MPQLEERAPLLGEQAQRIYDTKLKSIVEPLYVGKSIAIHVDSEDYAVGESHRDAARKLLDRAPKDGRIVTLTIGPPTDSDIRLASRMSAGRKR